MLDFTFNGWGNKYPATADNNLTRNLFQQKAFSETPLTSIDMVLEGGAIEVDGEGTLLTTKSCLLSPTRNADLSLSQIEENLKKYLGIERILWLEHGALAGDDTDGHIDTLARFIDPHTICYVKCSDPQDTHFQTLQAMENELRAFRDYQGNPYRLIPLPLPKPIYADFDGRRLPATYANFLFVNDGILVPTYDDAANDEAFYILAECFSDREIVTMPCLPVVQWYGSLHCMTMQLPAGVVSSNNDRYH